MHQQIQALEERAMSDSERALLAGLRMCRAYVERELRRRGWALTDRGWRPLS